ncbi:hypothetical protein [Aeromonas australiensis]|uniref:hypothetical protein n=1 Tax=Aeromonas australiensis TaxID=1114880 RepID=UPI001427AAD7|nr:hypothetical protein [Aeromonas australiensis]
MSGYPPFISTIGLGSSRLAKMQGMSGANARIRPPSHPSGFSCDLAASDAWFGATMTTMVTGQAVSIPMAPS